MRLLMEAISITTPSTNESHREGSKQNFLAIGQSHAVDYPTRRWWMEVLMSLAKMSGVWW